MTAGRDRILLAEQLRTALADTGGLPARDIDSIKVLIEAGELGIALETLCTQLYEYDIEVTGEQRVRLEELGQKLGVSAAYLLGDPWADAPDPDGD
ncbi:MAG: MafI family immunity protein [Acidimicrobiales bacterium]